MKVQRTGARADHGNQCIYLDKCSIRWDKDKRVMEISQRDVADFHKCESKLNPHRSKHNYTIELTRLELATILERIGFAIQEHDKSS